MSLSARFECAFQYAAVLHAHQKRKGTDIPYISHLLAVAGLVIENGGTEDEAIAALLHDAVEDAGGRGRLSDIRARFGEAVAEIVTGCSDADVIPKPPFAERKQAYLADLKKGSPSVLLVSCADKVHNARAILSDYEEQGEALWGRFNGGREGTLWYYRALADEFLRLGPERLSKELDRVVAEIEKLAAKV